MVQLRREHDNNAVELQEDYMRKFKEVATHSERNLKVNALTLTVQNLVLSLANCLMTQKER